VCLAQTLRHTRSAIKPAQVFACVTLSHPGPKPSWVSQSVFQPLIQAHASPLYAACTQEEVNQIFAAAKAAQKAWARTALCKRAEALHRVAALMREHAQPIADCLVKEIAKPSKDALTEVISTQRDTLHSILTCLFSQSLECCSSSWP